MHITRNSWLIVLAGAVAFGAAIVGLARALPSDSGTKVPGDEVRADAGTAGLTGPRATGDTTSSVAQIGLPPASGPVLDPILNAPAFDYGPPGVMTRDARAAELAAIATTYDIVVDDLRWQPDGVALAATQIAAMKAANPRLRVLRYVGTLTNNDGPIFNVVPDDGVHGSWFLRDGSGEFVRAYNDVAAWNGKPSYAFDPASADVRNDIGAWVRQLGKLGYDGVLLDGIAGCVPARASGCDRDPLLSHPLSKTTNRPYSDAEWLAAVTGLLQAIRRSAPSTQVFLRADAEHSALLPYVDGTVALSP